MSSWVSYLQGFEILPLENIMCCEPCSQDSYPLAFHNQRISRMAALCTLLSWCHLVTDKEGRSQKFNQIQSVVTECKGGFNFAPSPGPKTVPSLQYAFLLTEWMNVNLLNIHRCCEKVGFTSIAEPFRETLVSQDQLNMQLPARKDHFDCRL